MRDNLVLTPCLVDLEVDRIVDILWNVTAFESLVTDDRTKELIHALVTNQLAAEKATDLIAGKGNGLIMLLHGGPGTGKTFTAESMAEIAQKPLYRVTCGDIGTNPEEVEKYLESVLHLGKIWSCVVLLDEANIFLEEGTLADLQRNAPQWDSNTDVQSCQTFRRGLQVPHSARTSLQELGSATTAADLAQLFAASERSRGKGCRFRGS